MTEEEWKAFEEKCIGVSEMDANFGDTIRSVTIRPPMLLAAYRELKERREDEEFLRGNVFPYFDGEGVGWKVRRWDDRCLIGEGPTLHAAILAARKEK